MRKNSAQLYKEVVLDFELTQLPKEERLLLDSAIDDLTNFRLNEMEALQQLINITHTANLPIAKYVSDVIIKHSRTLLEILGLTAEGFKSNIEDLEKKREAYKRMRNN